MDQADLIGQVRNDYSEVWIILPFILIGSLLAIVLVTPVIIHHFCRSICSNGPCQPCWFVIDHFVESCGESFKSKINSRNRFSVPANHQSAHEIV